jgi:hypothetical protein
VASGTPEVGALRSDGKETIPGLFGYRPLEGFYASLDHDFCDVLSVEQST